MQKIYFISLFILFSNKIQAQNTVSYQNEVKKNLFAKDTAQYLTAFYYFYFNQLAEYSERKESQRYFDEALPIALQYRKKSLKTNSYASQLLLISYIHFNTSYYLISNEKKYIQLLSEDLEEEQKNTDKNIDRLLPMEIQLYRFWAVLKQDIGEYGMALHYIERVTKLIVLQQQKFDRLIALDTKQYKKAKLKADQVWSKKYILPNIPLSMFYFNKPDDYYLSLAYATKSLEKIQLLNDMNAGQMNFYQAKYDSANYYFQKVEQFINSSTDKLPHSYIQYHYYNFSEFYHFLSNPYKNDDKAIEILKKGIKNSNKLSDNFDFKFILAEILYHKKDYKAALITINESLSESKLNFNKAQLLVLKSKILIDQKKYKEALLQVEQAIDCSLKEPRFNKDDIPQLSQISDQGGIILALFIKINILYKINRLNEALKWIKYTDNLINVTRNNFEMIDDAQRYINESRFDLFETALEICHQQEKTAEAFQFIENAHFAILNESLRKVSKSTKNNASLSLKQLQNKLAVNQTFVSYFEGEKGLYVFWVNRQRFDFKKLSISIPHYRELKDRFLNLCNNSAFDDGLVLHQQVEAIKKQFPSIAYELYKELFLPLGIAKGQRIIISTNDNLLPFAALMKTNKSFDIANYLINDYTFSYAFSANLLFNPPLIKKKAIQKQFLVVHPKHFDTSLNLNDLDDNQTLWKIKAKGYSMNILEEQEATKQNFLNHYSQAEIIYFFTHAQASNKEPSIYFQSDSLQFKEIYEFQGKLAAELVCFASCETSKGKKIIGEGNMSLAMGFAYIGVPTTITTLWSVFSNYTANLYQSFFKNMSQGQTKELALKNAQLDFLSQATPHAQLPISWAGMIVVGDTKVILPEQQSYVQILTWILTALVILFMMILMWIIKEKKNAVRR